MNRLSNASRFIATMFFFAAAGFWLHNGASANNISWFLSSSDPFLQDWSITTSITSDDNWDNVMSVLGYRGDDLTTATGTDPQTVLADGSSTPVDVIANQSSPGTNTTGGVAEFDGMVNPTVALQGSGTADAPHLVIRLNKKNCPDNKFITIAYKVRDIDGSGDNAVQPVALHYRVGDTGNYANIPEAFVADATEGGTATKETTVFATLPHIPVGQDLIFLRIMTTNAVGSDEWVGIDDITIGCFVPTAAAVSVSGRILKSKTRSISGAVIEMTDEFGVRRTARSNLFGFYRFDGVTVGQNYTFEIRAKGYDFAPRSVAVDDAIADLDFIAR